MADLNEAELSNLITACMTSSMRAGSEQWASYLNTLADKLRNARARLDRGESPVDDHLTWER